ncbi:MAG: histidine utilization repressor [Mesorhizobium amorphae]|nr:MAG: histidine utilization repressor [Mesorhizobium amorphae]
MNASLHQRIVGEIESRIASGAWPPGHPVPTEMRLAEEYGCSRMTANKALSQLARTGLIERRRKAGSVVARPRSQSAVLEIPDIGAEVRLSGASYDFDILERTERAATAADRARIGLDGGAPVLALTAIHWAGDKPFCLEDRLISLDAVPEASAETFAETAPGSWLVARVPWSSAEHRIRACAADRREANLLDLSPAAPCLAIERRTWSAGQPVTQVTLLYPGQSHALVARFAPGG